MIEYVYVVNIVAGSVKYDFCTFDTEKEAETFCAEHNWVWMDDNAFVWDLEITAKQKKSRSESDPYPKKMTHDEWKAAYEENTRKFLNDEISFSEWSAKRAMLVEQLDSILFDHDLDDKIGIYLDEKARQEGDGE
ncbi:hypothetical protein [Treponema sp.]|uniref:hypothetical protein n=1 Tax=Treponema sp. TaxID=166 RepID=UPI00388DF431